MDKIISKSDRQTGKLAEEILAKIDLEKLDKPLVFLLKGELGGGKTVFVKGLAKYLGIKETITSPTFVLYNTYKIKFQDQNSKKSKQISRSKFQNNQTENILIHWDLYRIENPKELEVIGFWEIIKSANVACIEWPENMGKKYLEKIKKETRMIEIRFEYGKNLSERIIKIGL